MQPPIPTPNPLWRQDRSRSNFGNCKNWKLKDQKTPQVNFFQETRTKSSSGTGKKGYAKEMLQDRSIKKHACEELCATKLCVCGWQNWVWQSCVSQMVRDNVAWDIWDIPFDCWVATLALTQPFHNKMVYEWLGTGIFFGMNPFLGFMEWITTIVLPRRQNMHRTTSPLWNGNEAKK